MTTIVQVILLLKFQGKKENTISVVEVKKTRVVSSVVSLVEAVEIRRSL